MATLNQTHRGKSSLEPSNGFTIKRVVTPAIADTEFTHTFPDGVKKFSIRTRDNFEIKVSDVTGFTDDYFTIKKHNVWSEDNISTASLTVYMKTSASSGTIEIMEWT